MQKLNQQLEALKELKAQSASVYKEAQPYLNKINSIEDKINKLEFVIEGDIRVANKELIEKFENEGAYDVYIKLNSDDSFRGAVEDDGFLHIQIGQVSAAFIGDQDLKKSEWNAKAKPILKAFGFKWSDLK